MYNMKNWSFVFDVHCWKTSIFSPCTTSEVFDGQGKENMNSGFPAGMTSIFTFSKTLQMTKPRWSGPMFFFLLIKVFFKVKKKWNDEKRCFSIWNNRFSSFYVYRWHFELRFLEMYFTLFQHHELMPDIWKYYNSMILYYMKQTVENMWHSKMSDAMIL